MGQKVLSYKLDDEVAERFEALVAQQLGREDVNTKGEAIAALVPVLEADAAAAGSPTVAANLAAMRKAADVMLAQGTAMAQALAGAEEAAAVESRKALDVQARALAAAQDKADELAQQLDAERAERAEEQQTWEVERASLAQQIADRDTELEKLRADLADRETAAAVLAQMRELMGEK